ncbi:MAG: hypothetical protein LAO51_14375 [Acidobacteriia bacterium]|nr:hypothetical protein [Terriglobia bacterium]
MTQALVLVRELRRKGVTLALSGDRIVLDAPSGAITPEHRETLRAAKLELVRVLEQEGQVLEMSLREFERCGYAVEATVPWLSETLWFVPRVEHIRVLMADGVRRGRIWTARELTDLLSISGMNPQDIAGFARLKAAFGIDVFSVEQGFIDVVLAEELKSQTNCSSCGQGRFWRSIHGALVCGTCHPPAAPELVAEWIDAVEPNHG